MRRLTPIVLLVALALAGCGSSSSKHASSSGNSVLESEVSYFPAGTPFVVSVATKPSSGAVQSGMSLAGQFPLAGFGEQLLMSKLQQAGINYQTDIKPLFGNPVLLGINNADPVGNAAEDVLGVWQTANGTKVAALLKRIFPGLQSAASHDGAKVYLLGGTAIALDGPTLLVGLSEQQVDAALDRHANRSGFSASTYEKLVGGLPPNSLFAAVGNLNAVLSTPGAAKARTVPWVHAITGYGATMNATTSGVSLQFRVDTSGGTLTSAQLPIATGSATPELAGNEPISVGLSNPSQAIKFIESTAQELSPTGYSRFQQGVAKIKAKTGVDVFGILNGLTGNAIVSSDTSTTTARFALTDGITIAQDLRKLVSQPLFKSGTPIVSLGGGFYRAGQITFGVSGNQFLLGRASAGELKMFGAAPATPAAGAQGSLAFRIALLPLLQLTLHSAPPQIVQTLLTSIGDITGWAASRTSALSGTAKLAVK